jgi:uncharacterized protein YodC (DUF2158 family)
MTEQSTFKVGDVVRMKSGGPRMTVVSEGGEQTGCQWFDEKKTLQSGRFHTQALELATDGGIRTVPLARA